MKRRPTTVKKRLITVKKRLITVKKRPITVEKRNIKRIYYTNIAKRKTNYRNITFRTITKAINYTSKMHKKKASHYI